jgi:hypothetical protein
VCVRKRIDEKAGGGGYMGGEVGEVGEWLDLQKC